MNFRSSLEQESSAGESLSVDTHVSRPAAQSLPQGAASAKQTSAGVTHRSPGTQSSVGASQGVGPAALQRQALQFRPTPGWKRGLDLGLGLLFLLLASPVMLFVALLIKLVSPGPVFFKQQRIGAMGRPFTMWKFRTMHPSTDPGKHRAYVRNLMTSEGPVRKLVHHDQFIPGGLFLRRSCIDELPQFLNVLQGNMSLVGPRPDVLPLESYGTLDQQRFEVLPGMTGYWQVSGKNETTFAEMMEMDRRYAQGRSLWWDLQILACTVAAVLRKAGDGE